MTKTTTQSILIRTVDALNRYFGLLALVLVGVGIFLFFNFRSDIISCNDKTQAYNAQVQIKRTDSSIENQQALADVIKAAQPLLEDSEATLDDKIDARRAFEKFTMTFPAYEKTAKRNPYKTQAEVCK